MSETTGIIIRFVIENSKIVKPIIVIFLWSPVMSRRREGKKVFVEECFAVWPNRKSFTFLRKKLLRLVVLNQNAIFKAFLTFFINKRCNYGKSNEKLFFVNLAEKTFAVDRLLTFCGKKLLQI